MANSRSSGTVIGSDTKVIFVTKARKLPYCRDSKGFLDLIMGIAIASFSGNSLSRHHGIKVFPAKKKVSNIKSKDKIQFHRQNH